MKKQLLALTLISALVLSATACDFDLPKPIGTTTAEEVTSTRPNETKAPGLDDYSPHSYDGDVLRLVVPGDSLKQAQTMPVSKGTVVLSEGLKQELEKLPDDQVFGVAISFASMIPEDHLDTLVYEGISASEYHEKALALIDTDKEASGEAMAKYYELRVRYYYDLLFSLSYIEYLDDRGGVTLEDCFFYAYLTKDEILHLECDEDESLYVFAPGLLK